MDTVTQSSHSDHIQRLLSVSWHHTHTTCCLAPFVWNMLITACSKSTYSSYCIMLSLFKKSVDYSSSYVNISFLTGTQLNQRSCNKYKLGCSQLVNFDQFFFFNFLNQGAKTGEEVPAFPLKVAPAQPCFIVTKCLQR